MPDAAELLARAQELHSQGNIDDALVTARSAIEAQPDHVEAWMYLGTTLITRRLAFVEGLSSLEHASALAPDDPGVAYSMGWCYEFVAYRLEKQAMKPFRDPIELYELAAERLRHCIALDPEPGLQEDAHDLLVGIEDRLE